MLWMSWKSNRTSDTQSGEMAPPPKTALQNVVYYLAHWWRNFTNLCVFPPNVAQILGVDTKILSVGHHQAKPSKTIKETKFGNQNYNWGFT